MPASRPLLLSILLVPLLTLPSGAQRLAPVALRVSDGAPLASSPTTSAPRLVARDTEPEPAREPSVVGTLIGGVLGGTLGTFVGAMVGANANSGCQGDLCEVGGALLGVLIGEPLGLAIGAHLGSRSTRHEHVLMSSFASAGILVGGVAVAIGVAHLDGTVGTVMVPLIPVLQLVTTVAIESH
jgi:hypothetical protein